MKSTIALIGLPGSGKTLVSKQFEKEGYVSIRLGDITDEELKKRNMEVNEENESQIREEIRKTHGMDAYAKLSLEKIKEFDKVVIDGMRSEEEFIYFKSHLGRGFHAVFIDASPMVRYYRLGRRKVRPLTESECKARDERELKVLGMEKTITKADLVLTNNGEMEELRTRVISLLKNLNNLSP